MFVALKQDIDNNAAVSLPQYDNHVSMIKTEECIKLVSNICPHQNARLVSQGTEFVCPYHGRRFDFQGQGIDNPYQLESWAVHTSDALIFDQPVSAQFPIDLSHMKLIESRVDFVRNSPEVIMDVFLDIEHIDHVHAGVYDSIGIAPTAEIAVTFFENGSMQLVQANAPTHAIDTDAQCSLAAIWMAVYPGSMIEWQPGSLFVTVAHSINSNGSKVQVFKYQDSRYHQTVHALNDQIWETAWQQDQVIAANIVQLADDNLNHLQQDFRKWMQTHAV